MRNKNLIVCGDINLNLLKQTPDSEHYLIKMASYGLDSKINDPTRITNNSQTLIDHVFERHGLAVDPEIVAWVAWVWGHRCD